MRGATTSETQGIHTTEDDRSASLRRARRTGTAARRAVSAGDEGPRVVETTATTREVVKAGSASAQRASDGAGIGIGSASALPGLPALPAAYTGYSRASFAEHTQPFAADPDVWLIAHATASGRMLSLEGAGRSGAIRVARPFGHLRSVQPVLPPEALGTLEAASPSASLTSGVVASESPTGRLKRARSSKKLESQLPAHRPAPLVVSAVEVETDSGLFRVERPGGVLGHSDLAWALSQLESGEPDSVVPLPRRQLAMLLTLLPTPEDPERPEQDPTWGWAHKLRGPWERGPLHTRGRLGRLISVDPDPTGRGQHRASFELLGSEEIAWAHGVPCFRSGSVYELVPISRSRWLSWPLAKGRARAGSPERPEWEIARVVYRVGQPRWPLAGVVEPVGPMGIGG